MFDLTAFADALAARITEENAARGANVIDLCVMRGDEVQNRRFFPAQGPLNCQSVAKSFIATAIGILIDEGKIALSDPLPALFGGHALDDMPKEYDRVTLHHLLTHTTGTESGFLYHGYPNDDWLSACLTAPLPHAPGSRFCYSNSNYYLLSRLIGIASGISAADFLGERIMKPLGITEYAFERCPRGHVFGASGLYLSTFDMCRLGHAYLTAHPMLSPDWIATATTPRTEHIPYGYGFWIRPHGYGMNGYGGQIVEVIPEASLVVGCHAAGGCQLAQIACELLGI